MKTWHKAAAAVAVAALLFPQPAKALLGEDIPYLIQLVKQGIESRLSQRDLYTLTQKINSAIRGGQAYFKTKNWQGAINEAAGYAGHQAQNVYGETYQWSPAMTTGIGTEPAWDRAATQARTAAWVANDASAQSQLATREILDSAAITGMTVHGQSIEHQQQMTLAVQKLELAAMDTSGDTNSEVQQLNLLTAGTTQSLRMQQTANAVSLARLQLAVTQVKAQRDAIAQRLSYDADVEQYSQQEGPTMGNISSSLGWIPK